MEVARKGPARDRILDDVRRHPGSSARDVQRRLELGWGDTAYQLDRLVQSGDLRRERGGWRDYYFTREMTWFDRRIWQALRSRAERTLVLATMDRPGSTFTQLVERTGLSRSTVSFHLRKLVELQVLSTEGSSPGNGYRVLEPERLRELLATYTSTLRDDLVDGFADAFGGLGAA